MHGFITRDGTPPLELLAAARKELSHYASVVYTTGHVESIARDAHLFQVRTDDGDAYCARRILLATGVYDALPHIDGLREAWGVSAFVCPYCDAYEVRDTRIAVVGPGRKAVELAQELRQWSSDILICTQGEALAPEDKRWIEAVRAAHKASPIARIQVHAGQITGVEFDDGAAERCNALFLSAPLRPRYPLVDMLGCALREDGEIAIDARGRTSVDRVYAAGDAVTRVHQVVLAAASGVCAAMAVNDDFLKDDVAAVLSGVEEAERPGDVR